MISDCFKKIWKFFVVVIFPKLMEVTLRMLCLFLNKMLMKNLKFMRCYHTLALKLLDEVKV